MSTISRKCQLYVVTYTRYEKSQILAALEIKIEFLKRFVKYVLCAYYQLQILQPTYHFFNYFHRLIKLLQPSTQSY